MKTKAELKKMVCAAIDARRDDVLAFALRRDNELFAELARTQKKNFLSHKVWLFMVCFTQRYLFL